MRLNRTIQQRIHKGAVALVVALQGCVIVFGTISSQNATNGIYGGYVGSDRWFAMMRQTAANQAMMRSLARTTDPQKLPPEYVEFAGQITFPGGNPFPAQRLPDLRIVSRNQAADEVERAPFVDDNAGFYTVLKKGQTYDLFWMYYFGSREQFASITVRPDAPRQIRQSIAYTAPNTSAGTTAAQSQEVARPSPATPRPAAPANADRFDTSGLPRTPANFEEQQLAEIVREDGKSALGHEKLAAYYEKKGDVARANAEREKANYWRNPAAYAPPASAAPPVSKPDGPGPGAALAPSDVDTPPPFAPIPNRETSVAVVIGVSQYREPDIPKLPFARRDAESVAAYLQNVAGIRRENIRLISDNRATRSDIEEAVEQWLPRHTTAASSVVLYYAGHGALDPATGDAYLAPHEGHPESPATRMYPLKRLYEKLDALSAANVTVLLDSCFSGGGRSIAMKGRPILIAGDNLALNSRKLVILAAAGANQVSSDLERTGHGLFTYFLLKGLRGEADASHDGWVDLFELFNFVKTNVRSTALSELDRDQTPTLAGSPDVDARAKALRLFRTGR